MRRPELVAFESECIPVVRNVGARRPSDDLLRSRKYALGEYISAVFADGMHAKTRHRLCAVVVANGRKVRVRVTSAAYDVRGKRLVTPGDELELDRQEIASVGA